MRWSLLLKRGSGRSQASMRTERVQPRSLPKSLSAAWLSSLYSYQPRGGVRTVPDRFKAQDDATPSVRSKGGSIERGGGGAAWANASALTSALEHGIARSQLPQRGQRWERVASRRLHFGEWW
jgi:hypothetical protein